MGTGQLRTLPRAPALRPRMRRIGGGRRGPLVAALLGCVALSLTVAAPAGHAVPSRRPPAVPYEVGNCGDRDGKVLLTIDDFPYHHPNLVWKIARDALNQWHVGMVGFPLGRELKAYRRSTGVSLTARARHFHMWLGNHTYDHPNLTALSSTQVRSEILRGNTSTLLRPPYGSYDSRVKTVAKSLGYRICTWNIDTEDWRRHPTPHGMEYRSVAGIRSEVLRQLAEFHDRPGMSVVILGHYMTNWPLAIPRVIHDLRARGYQFCRPSATPTTATIPPKLPC